MTRTTEDIKESGSAQIGLKPDVEKGIIPSVQLHADRSVNGYRYTEKAMRSIARLYENAGIFSNHGPAAVEDLLGCPRNISVQKQDDKFVIRADAELDTKHSLYGSIMEHASRRPHLLRFSHEIPKGEASLTRIDGEVFVDDVFKIGKISLIAEPGGVNKNIYESDNRASHMEIKSVADFKSQYPELAKAFNEQVLQECSCQKEGGAVAQAIALQAEVETLKSDILERDERIETFECEKLKAERTEAIIQEAAAQNRVVPDVMLEMFLNLSGDDREEKIKAAISNLPEIRENDQGGKKTPTPKQRSNFEDPSSDDTPARRNAYTSLVPRK